MNMLQDYMIIMEIPLFISLENSLLFVLTTLNNYHYPLIGTKHFSDSIKVKDEKNCLSLIYKKDNYHADG